MGNCADCKCGCGTTYDLLEVTKLVERQKASMLLLIEQLRDTFTEDEYARYKDVAQRLDYESFRSAMVGVFERHYTAKEIGALVRFYRSPLGQGALRMHIGPMVEDLITTSNEWATRQLYGGAFDV